MSNISTFEGPIVFHSMHAGCVRLFSIALSDATTLVTDCSIKVYGAVLDNEVVRDLRDGRQVRLTGSETEKFPYALVVCLKEGDLNTLRSVYPPSGYWDTVEFTPVPGRYHPSRMQQPQEK